MHASSPTEALPTELSQLPVFHQPWEARVFALVLNLHRNGHFSWPEWVTSLSTEIRIAKEHGHDDLGHDYYEHWLAALGKLLVTKTWAEGETVSARAIEIEKNRPTGHGHVARREPIKVA